MDLKPGKWRLVSLHNCEFNNVTNYDTSLNVKMILTKRIREVNKINFNKLNPYIGLWVKNITDQPISITERVSTIEDELFIHIQKGWNLIAINTDISCSTFVTTINTDLSSNHNDSSYNNYYWFDRYNPRFKQNVITEIRTKDKRYLNPNYDIVEDVFSLNDFSSNIPVLLQSRRDFFLNINDLSSSVGIIKMPHSIEDCNIKITDISTNRNELYDNISNTNGYYYIKHNDQLYRDFSNTIIEVEISGGYLIHINNAGNKTRTKNMFVYKNYGRLDSINAIVCNNITTMLVNISENLQSYYDKLIDISDNLNVPIESINSNFHIESLTVKDNSYNLKLLEIDSKLEIIGCNAH